MKLAAREGDTVGEHGGVPVDEVEIEAMIPGTPSSVCAVIARGDDSVFIEGQPAARIDDEVRHGSARLREGARKVLIGNRPAARDGDASTCGGRVTSHATRTLIGGPSTSDEDDAPPPLGSFAQAILDGMLARQRANEPEAPAAAEAPAKAEAPEAGAGMGAALARVREATAAHLRAVEEVRAVVESAGGAAQEALARGVAAVTLGALREAEAVCTQAVREVVQAAESSALGVAARAGAGLAAGIVQDFDTVASLWDSAAAVWNDPLGTALAAGGRVAGDFGRIAEDELYAALQARSAAEGAIGAAKWATDMFVDPYGSGELHS